MPERQDCRHEQQAGKEDRNQSDQSGGQWMRIWPHRGADIGRKGEQRTGQRLRRSIPREEHLSLHPALGNNQTIEQWEYDMAAAEDKRSRAEEVCEEAERGQAAPPNCEANGEKDCKECSGSGSRSPGYGGHAGQKLSCCA